MLVVLSRRIGESNNVGEEGADSDDDKGDVEGDGDGEEGDDNDDGGDDDEMDGGDDDEIDGGDDDRSNDSRCFRLLAPPVSSCPILTSFVM